LLAGNHFDCQIAAGCFAAQAGHGHSASRKRSADGHIKTKRGIGTD
jgi:hypothetical protein